MRVTKGFLQRFNALLVARQALSTMDCVIATLIHIALLALLTLLGIKYKEDLVLLIHFGIKSLVDCRLI